MRSSLFSGRNLIRLLAPEALTPHRLAADLTGLLADETVPDQAGIPALDGAERTAQTLLGSELPRRPCLNGSAPQRAAADHRLPTEPRTGIEVSPI
jgi:hypothetical protein